MNCLGTLPGRTAQGSVGLVHASQEARMFRVSSVPRPARDVFADLIRPSEPLMGHLMG